MGMSRTEQDQTAGVLHQIAIRGIERRRVFKDDADPESVVERLGLTVAGDRHERPGKWYVHAGRAGHIAAHAPHRRPGRFLVFHPKDVCASELRASCVAYRCALCGEERLSATFLV